MRSVIRWAVDLRKRYESTVAAVGLIIVVVIVFAMDQTNDRNQRRASEANCVRNREDLRTSMVAVADGIIDAALASPGNQAPERQAEIESFRRTLIEDFTAGVADPEGCH